MIVLAILISLSTTLWADEFNGRMVFTTDYKGDWVENRGEVRGAPYIKGTLYIKKEDGLKMIKEFTTDGDGYFGFALDEEGSLFVKVVPAVEMGRVGWVTREAKVFQYNPFTKKTYGGDVLLKGSQGPSGLYIFNFDEAVGKRRFARRNLHVLSSIHKVSEFLIKKVDWSPDQVEVRIFEPIERWTGWRYEEGHIRLAGGDEFSEKNIIHEYVHAINSMLYGLPSYFEGVGGEHDLNYESSQRAAWIEAWPHFFIAHILGREWVRLAKGKCIQDIENNLWYYGVDGDWRDNSGEVVEGAIASVLWDLSDGVGEDDEFDGDLMTIWSVLKEKRPVNFRQFWESFNGGQTFRRICETNGIVYSRGKILGIKTKDGLRRLKDGDPLPRIFTLKVGALTKEELNVVTALDEIDGAIIQCKKVPKKGVEWETEWDMEGWETIGRLDEEGWRGGWVRCDATRLPPGEYQLVIRVKSKNGYDTLRPIEIRGRDGVVRMANPLLLSHLRRLGTIVTVVFR